MCIRDRHRPQWTEEELDVIFSKATLVLGELRKDASGVYIHRDAYGKAEHPLGWEVDHIKPISEGGTNELSNLRPLNIPANRGRNN